MARIVDTPRAFGAGSIVLHWTVAALTVALIVTGYMMLGMGRGPAKAAMIARHTDIGWAVAMILVLRIGWRVANPLPALSEARPWENTLARVVQWSMLGLLVVFAVTGYLSVATNPRLSTVSVLGWFELPRIDDPDRALHRGSEEIHSLLSHVFAAILLLHVAGTFKRSLIDRDGTLGRMLWPRRDAPGAAE